MEHRGDVHYHQLPVSATVCSTQPDFTAVCVHLTCCLGTRLYVVLRGLEYLCHSAGQCHTYIIDTIVMPP